MVQSKSVCRLPSQDSAAAQYCWDTGKNLEVDGPWVIVMVASSGHRKHGNLGSRAVACILVFCVCVYEIQGDVGRVGRWAVEACLALFNGWERHEFRLCWLLPAAMDGPQRPAYFTLHGPKVTMLYCAGLDPSLPTGTAVVE